MRNLNRLTISGITLLALLFSGCAQDSRCDGPFESVDESWSPVVMDTPAHSVFQSARYPLDTARGNFHGYTHSIWVGGTLPHEDPAIQQETPTRIQLYFVAHYAPTAVRHWREDGYLDTLLIVDDPYADGDFAVNVDLELPSLKVGTYAFSATDTADGLTPALTFKHTRYPQGEPSLQPAHGPTGFTGHIKITKKFTANSGSFSYQIEVQHRPGQKTVYKGTGHFTGYSHYFSCGWY
jgi:hypothetical protein